MSLDNLQHYTYYTQAWLKPRSSFKRRKFRSSQMDPPQNPPTAGDSLPPLPNPKIRLMCSYGGQIAPRPHDRSLCYLGGDTRIVALDRRTTAASLSSLTSHLSKNLYNNRPFMLKYQLPNEDLDSLISVTTDEDLYNMIEEHDRIISSNASSRIRLFLFPFKRDLSGSVLLDPKSESWFCDALKSARIMQGMEDSYGENGEVINKQESMILDTSSSFGSSGSSASMANLPPIGVYPGDKKVKLASPISNESSNRRIGVSQPQLTPDESESIIFDPSSMIHVQKPLQTFPYQIPEQRPRQHEVQYVQAAPHYLPQYPTMPISYYPMYNPRQQHIPHQPYPLYFVNPAQPYSVPVTQNINEAAYNDATSAGDPLEGLSANQNPNLELDDDLACAQIYKSQPTGPVLPNQYQTLAAGVVSSET